MFRLFSLLIGAIVVAPLGAQGSGGLGPPVAHPDLSGTWNLDISSLDPAAAAMVSKTTMVVTQNAKILVIRTTSATSEGERGSTVTYHFDSESKDTVTQAGAPAVRTSSATWDGPVLVVKTKSESRGQTVDITSRYSLDATGTLLTHDAHLVLSVGGENQSRQIYRKALAHSSGD